MIRKGKKLYADKGKFLYCEKLNRYCTSTTDLTHEWIDVDEREDKKDAR